MPHPTPEPFWRHKNVFVTGCTGLLGSWLVRELLEREANVTGLIRDWVPGSHLICSGMQNKINVVRGEVEDYFVLERALNEYEVKVVFHLAAQTIVGTANRGPRSTFETNIKGTWNLLEACRRSPLIRSVVIASSDKAYGSSTSLPYTESTPLAGEHPYDVSKSCGDLLARSYFCTYHLPVCITRCGNFFGGGDLNYNRIVPGTIRSVLYNQRPVIRTDGSYVRDYFYVKDAVQAYVFLAEKMYELEIAGEAFNFSNEVKMTVLEMTRKILQVMGREDLEPIFLKDARNEITCQYLSAEKARTVLGWKPTYTLEQGLGETVEWYRRFFAVEGGNIQ